MLKNKRNITILALVVLVAVGGGSFKYIKYMKDAPYRQYLSEADEQIAEKRYVQAALSLEKARKIKITKELADKTNLVSLCIKQNKILENASKAIEERQYNRAMEELSSINPKAVPVKEEADKKIEICKNEIIKNNSNSIISDLSNNDFDGAYSALNKIIKVDPNSEKISALKKQIEDRKTAYEAEKQNIAVAKKENNNKLNQSLNKETKITAEEAMAIAKKAYEDATGDYSHKYGTPFILNVDNIGECYKVIVYDNSGSENRVDKESYVLVKTHSNETYIFTAGEGMKTIE